MKTRYKDRLGSDIYEGDVLLYSTASGTGGRIECYKVIGQTEHKLKVTSGKRPYSSKPQVHYINHPEAGIVITHLA